ncbi:MAG TPA: aromatic-ring-hydroxylating dioxygenase subunit beta [Pusillimonas sp.]|uniref:aromatic-ring-hydroxylating dioxygenase subunit beta n=1 Tax=unclassified Pusillimonas TaxID=2640016 RepID=UPI0026191918|nr:MULTISPECIES: aromatic-ring-hydroxylating dioxygenase subunit beta [unclassified Pusillimonas]HLU19752.1 aromatic-ring-hydroxylating dioxygenase subunit beta [Pusillimonas sp.]
MLFDIDLDVSAVPAKDVTVPLETYHRIQQFIYHEARLLDERQWQAWLDLWTDDGMYWIPQQHDQNSPFDHISLCWDNGMLRELRLRTLDHPRNWAQQPITHATRVVGNVMVDGTDPDGCLIVRSAFHMTEWRKDQPRHMAGSYIHKLVTHEDSWRIRLKQVNLVNCDAVHSAIQVYI